MKRVISLFVCAFILITGLAHATEKEDAVVLIKDVPHVKQKPDFCGEACIEMYLAKLGHKDITQDDVFNLTAVDPLRARGAYTREMRKALQLLGFKPGQTWYQIPADNSKKVDEQWNSILDGLKKGTPTIACMNTKGGTEHFRLILGYDQGKDEIIYHEPAAAKGAYQRMKLATFKSLWPLKYNKKTWTLVHMSLATDKVVPLGKQNGFTDADFAQHMMQLKQKIPKDQGFTVVIQKPFVVIGNEAPDIVKRRAEGTVHWATKRLKLAYFKKDPEHIIDIWLFKDKKTYLKYCWEIFREKPDTPYGFSSSFHRALIMNIGTGGGTLVHEMVHPFIRTNFPECPSWFNEGLASLYEQSRGEGNHIIGLTNWRLTGLKKVIKAGKLPSFKELTSTTTQQFYNEDRGDNYAQARYLCYYLQEMKLLNKFYREFRKNHKTDPTGYRTLQKVLGTEDMTAFQKKWEAYVMKLHFP